MSQLAGYLAGEPVVFFAVCVLLGLIVGSFLNVVIYRLPRMMEREWRSQCRELLEGTGDTVTHRETAPGEVADEPAETFNLLIPNSQRAGSRDWDQGG